MFRRAFLLLLISALVVCLPGGASAWKFVSMADSRGDNNGVNTAVLTNIVNRINAENVDLLIFQGDAVSGCDDACLSSQMDTWLSIMNTLNCPWYYTAGNHEVTTSTAQENVLRAKVNMPLNGPAGDLEMAYSFDHQNAHFVSLNSDHYGQQHHVQRSWLSSDLAATNQPHVFVYSHDPAYPAGPHIGSSLDAYPSERDDFWNIMSNAGVRMYFCGHEHLYQRSLHGSIYQVLNGTCGAPIHTGYPNTIAQYQYVVVTVEGSNVSAVCKSDSGAVLDTWTYSVTQPMDVSCDSAKDQQDGTYVRLADRVVTCVRGNAVYVEEDDRAAAFRVAGVSGISVGDRITATGTLQTNSDGEREILGSALKLSSDNDVPGPLGMTNKTLLGGPSGYNPGADGGNGCNTSSLLVKTFGKVTAVGSGSNAGMFYIDDGSGLSDGTSWDGSPNVGVRVVWNGLVTEGDTIAVTGICSAFKNGTDVCRQIYSTDRIVLGSFTAYNDCCYSASSGHPVLRPNVTTYSIGSGAPGPASGLLKDITTGADTGITATLTQSGGVIWQPDPVTGGGDCSAGTDAAITFNPTVSLMGVIYYGSSGWWVDLELSGLDPGKLYQFETTANRKGGSSYLDRLTKYTLSGADTYSNTSTPGSAISGASTTFCTGENTSTGYVARWTSINPGSDGKIKIRSEAGSSQYKAYSFDAFRLTQLP